MHTDKNNIRLRFENESFWAYKYPDLPDNQAEVNNYLFTDNLSFGDRVEFNDDNEVVRIVMTAEEVKNSYTKEEWEKYNE